MTHESRWQPWLGERIAAVDVYWSWVQYEGDPKHAEYPQSLRLTFESGAQVYLSAFEIRDNGFRMGCMDHVTYFSTEWLPRSTGLGLPAIHIGRHKKSLQRTLRRATLFISTVRPLLSTDELCVMRFPQSVLEPTRRSRRSSAV